MCLGAKEGETEGERRERDREREREGKRGRREERGERRKEGGEIRFICCFLSLLLSSSDPSQEWSTHHCVYCMTTCPFGERQGAPSNA